MTIRNDELISPRLWAKYILDRFRGICPECGKQGKKIQHVFFYFKCENCKISYRF